MTAPSSTVTFQIEAPIYTALSRKAKAEGIATGRYARMLFEAAWAARCKPVGDEELEAAIERMFKVAPSSSADADLLKKWQTACSTIEALRKDFATAADRHQAEISRLGMMVVEGVPAPDADTEALRAKITELSAQIVAAGEDRATAEAATKEAAKHLATISEMDTELGKVRLDLGQTAGWYQVALKRISDLEDELAAAKALPPPVLNISTDDLVTAIVMGWGSSFDSASMARNTGLSEATVARILSAWRDEIQARRAA